MQSLETELEYARELSVEELADAIETIGFECTRCGACCRSEADDPHTATVFPDEIRRLQGADAGGESGDVPNGGGEGDDGPNGEGEGDGESDGDGRSDDGKELDSGGDRGPGSDDGAGHGDRAGGDASDGDAPGGTEERDWRDVARPMPYGLTAGADGAEGETFEWALRTDDCGDCVFYEERAASEAPPGDSDAGGADGAVGACTVHDDRPLICETYPFSVALGGTSRPMGEAVDSAGAVRAHECEGLGRDIDCADAESLAAALKERAVRELEEAIGVRDAYEPRSTEAGEVVVHDSEGAKRPDGRPLDGEYAP
ncbi:zinc/iron-chelating domain-containing protein [Halobacteriales archaeon QS_6_71_20]|nr:MAG: zinc/iron-chelating domain-containing protein [Halobacteriales archaeon QS_6_71_20]